MVHIDHRIYDEYATPDDTRTDDDDWDYPTFTDFEYDDCSWPDEPGTDDTEWYPLIYDTNMHKPVDKPS
jgi:hypothetical protein